jgi:hypothetical protein
MWKIVKLPFIERFEYIGIANWLLIILPNVCITIWCSSQIIKKVFSIKMKKSVPIIALICLIVTNLIDTREHINAMTDLTSKVGFYFNFVYIPLLFVIMMIKKKVKNRDMES